MPNDRHIPPTVRFPKRHARQTTQPHPPSGTVTLMGPGSTVFVDNLVFSVFIGSAIFYADMIFDHQENSAQCFILQNFVKSLTYVLI